MRIVVAVIGLALLTSCSASRSRAPAGSTSPTTPAATPAPTSTPTSGTASAGDVAGYVAKVSALCDALLPKILAVTHDGDPGAFTVAQYKARIAGHTKLEKGFDAQFDRLRVPAGAEQAHAAMQAYIAYADRIDAQRLAAANQGQAAFERAITRENAAYESSAVKQARDAAGFSPSCDAR